jgi:hypothetical protein
LDFEKATPPPTNNKTIMSQTHHDVEVSFSSAGVDGGGADGGGADELEAGVCKPGKWLRSPIYYFIQLK